MGLLPLLRQPQEQRLESRYQTVSPSLWDIDRFSDRNDSLGRVPGYLGRSPAGEAFDMIHPCTVLYLVVPLGILAIQALPSFAQGRDRTLINEGPYIVVDANGLGEIYARSSAAGTRIYRVGEDRDELIDRYDWYCGRFPNKLYLISMGWTKGRPNIAVYRPNNLRYAGADPKKQVEFDLYLNGKHVRQFTTQQLVDLGAALNKSSENEIRGRYPANVTYADFTFTGYDGWNAGVRGGFGCYSLKMSSGRILLIDLATAEVIKDPYPKSGNTKRPTP